MLDMVHTNTRYDLYECKSKLGKYLQTNECIKYFWIDVDPFCIEMLMQINNDHILGLPAHGCTIVVCSESKWTNGPSVNIYIVKTIN